MTSPLVHQVGLQFGLPGVPTLSPLILMRRSAEIARAINETSEGDSLDMGQRTAELLMARVYDVAAREDVDAKTLQAVSRSLNSTLGTIASARGLRGEERRHAVEEAKDRAAGEARRQGLSPAGAAILRASFEGADPEDYLEDEEDKEKAARMETLRRIRLDVYGITYD